MRPDIILLRSDFISTWNEMHYAAVYLSDRYARISGAIYRYIYDLIATGFTGII